MKKGELSKISVEILKLLCNYGFVKQRTADKIFAGNKNNMVVYIRSLQRMGFDIRRVVLEGKTYFCLGRRGLVK